MTDKTTDKRRVALLTGITGQVCLFVFVRLVNSEKTSCPLNCGLIQLNHCFIDREMSAPYFLAFFGIFEATQSSDTRIQILQLITIGEHNVYLLVPKYLKPLYSPTYSYMVQYTWYTHCDNFIFHGNYYMKQIT